jgi:hypothetical protein
MVSMIEKGQWMVLPYHLVCTLPKLYISSMAKAIPGLRGLFSLFQEAFTQEMRKCIPLSLALHDFLDDIWMTFDYWCIPWAPIPLAFVNLSRSLL